MDNKRFFGKRVLEVRGLPTAVPAMQEYRKRPLVVSAVKMSDPFVVYSLEGRVQGKPGDYLVRGIRGELYCCDGEIFEASYDLVTTELSLPSRVCGTLVGGTQP